MKFSGGDLHVSVGQGGKLGVPMRVRVYLPERTPKGEPTRWRGVSFTASAAECLKLGNALLGAAAACEAAGAEGKPKGNEWVSGDYGAQWRVIRAFCDQAVFGNPCAASEVFVECSPLSYNAEFVEQVRAKLEMNGYEGVDVEGLIAHFLSAFVGALWDCEEALAPHAVLTEDDEPW